MSTIMPLVQCVTISPKRNEWGWFVASGWCEGEHYEMRYDHKPMEYIIRRDIRVQHKKYKATLPIPSAVRANSLRS